MGAPQDGDTMRPVLKYNGGKWLAGGWVVSHFPQHRIYGDLFGGGASVLLQKPRAKIEYYNDLDSGVYTFFRVLRDRPKDLIRAIRYTPYSREYYEHEAVHDSDDEITTALRFAARCWMGRSNNVRSSYRARGNLYSKGGYNPARLWSDLRPYIAAARRFRGVHIEHRDWYDSELYRRMLPGWRVVTRNVRDDARAERVEALFISPNVVSSKEGICTHEQ